jgi:aryl-alcohol dehydrogenase-like predicted oxidoreductase
VGEVFKDMREEVIFSTKYGYDFSQVEQIGHAELPQRFSEREFSEKMLHDSLDRLQTDYIDIYGLHNPKLYHIRDKNVFQFLDDKIDEGKIKTYQAALGPAIGWTAEGLESMEMPNLSVVQTVYNLFEQTPGRELLDNAGKKNVGIFVRVPDASGVLTGEMKTMEDVDRKIGDDDHRSVRKKEWFKRAFEKVEEVMHIGKQYEYDIMQLSMKFILSKKAITSIIPTFGSIEDIESFVSISDGEYLKTKDIEEIESIFDSWESYELKFTQPDVLNYISSKDS